MEEEQAEEQQSSKAVGAGNLYQDFQAARLPNFRLANFLRSMLIAPHLWRSLLASWNF